MYRERARERVSLNEAHQDFIAGTNRDLTRTSSQRPGENPSRTRRTAGACGHSRPEEEEEEAVTAGNRRRRRRRRKRRARRTHMCWRRRSRCLIQPAYIHIYNRGP